MICSSCGKEVRPDSLFCHHCGVKLESRQSSLSCSSCGKAVRLDSLFCHYCGAKIDRPQEIDPKHRRIWLTANAIGLALGLTVGWLANQLVLGSAMWSLFFSPLAWASVGLAIGAAQYYAFQQLGYLPGKSWIVATMIALPAGILLSAPCSIITGFATGGLLGNTSSDLAGGFMLMGGLAGFTAGLIGGGVVGFAQSKLFIHGVTTSRQWIGTNMLGWAIAGANFGAVQLWLSTFHLQGSGNLFWLTALLLVGMLGGLISGRVTLSAMMREIDRYS